MTLLRCFRGVESANSNLVERYEVDHAGTLRMFYANGHHSFVNAVSFEQGMALLRRIEEAVAYNEPIFDAERWIESTMDDFSEESKK